VNRAFRPYIYRLPTTVEQQLVTVFTVVNSDHVFYFATATQLQLHIGFDPSSPYFIVMSESIILPMNSFTKMPAYCFDQHDLKDKYDTKHKSNSAYRIFGLMRSTV
jgi:hypothetical protein